MADLAFVCGAIASSDTSPSPPSSCMRFRPCIDLHDGRVKQIVGSTLDTGSLRTNFSSDLPASHYATLYARDALPGGHVIMLGSGNTPAALSALSAFPGGLQIGGGLNPSNAPAFLAAGASHAIVTSYVFHDGAVDLARLALMSRTVGAHRLVLDLSCRRTRATHPSHPDAYLVTTNRWTRETRVAVSEETLTSLAPYCAEFLVHAVDVEGKRAGVDEELVTLLADASPRPVTYAGGARTLEDVERVREVGRGRVDVTVGSALDIFGGDMRYDDAVVWQRDQERQVRRDG